MLHSTSDLPYPSRHFLWLECDIPHAQCDIPDPTIDILDFTKNFPALQRTLLYIAKKLYVIVDNLFIFSKAFRGDMIIFALLKNGDLDYGKCVCKYDCSEIEYC